VCDPWGQSSWVPALILLVLPRMVCTGFSWVRRHHLANSRRARFSMAGLPTQGLVAGFYGRGANLEYLLRD
jgi:hypothetical protein